MTKYRLAIAVLWGIGFTSLVSLLLNLHLVFGIFLFPGGIATAILPNMRLDPNGLIFVSNVFIYSLAAFVLVSLRFRGGVAQLQHIAVWSIVPGATFAVLACFPLLNPLWPHRMAELTRTESELQNAIQLGMGLEQVRDALRSRHVQLTKFTEPIGAVVLQTAQVKITAQSGDIVLVGRFHTDAFNFPCGYDMQIVLLFGHNLNLKERYIRRLPLCP